MTRYGLTLKLDCEGAAFEDNRPKEIARVLRRLADKLEDTPNAVQHRYRVEGYLWDYNGNTCGRFDLKERRIRN